MLYKYNTSYIYNSSYIFFNKIKYKKNIFLNFKKNNKLIRKLYIFLLFNFYIKFNESSFFKNNLTDFLNYNYNFLNFLSSKSFYYYYFL
jgi:hypothetical protein